MEPVTTALAVGAVAGKIGGFLSGSKAAKKRRKAAKLEARAAAIQRQAELVNAIRANRINLGQAQAAAAGGSVDLSQSSAAQGAQGGFVSSTNAAASRTRVVNKISGKVAKLTRKASKLDERGAIFSAVGDMAGQIGGYAGLEGMANDMGLF